MHEEAALDYLEATERARPADGRPVPPGRRPAGGRAPVSHRHAPERRPRDVPARAGLHDQPRLAHRGAGAHGDGRGRRRRARPRRMRALCPLRRERSTASRRRSRAAARGLDRAALQALLPPGAARNAVDCALWDLEAKRRAAGSGSSPACRAGPEITAYTLSLDAPEAMRAKAAANAHRPLLKIKLGGEGDMARLEAVRAGAPRARPRRRRERGLDGGGLRRLAPALLRLGVEMVEQPLPAGGDEALADIARPAAGLRRRELPRPRLAARRSRAATTWSTSSSTRPAA
jgi:hypothetical protein